MAFEGQQGIVTNHATAVIGDLDEFFASGFDLNFDAGGTGVQRVFQEFFDHGGRALDDLSSGDFVGNGFGKDVNLTHESVASFSDEGRQSKGGHGFTRM